MPKSNMVLDKDTKKTRKRSKAFQWAENTQLFQKVAGVTVTPIAELVQEYNDQNKKG